MVNKMVQNKLHEQDINKLVRVNDVQHMRRKNVKRNKILKKRYLNQVNTCMNEWMNESMHESSARYQKAAETQIFIFNRP